MQYLAAVSVWKTENSNTPQKSGSIGGRTKQMGTFFFLHITTMIVLWVSVASVLGEPLRDVESPFLVLTISGL